MNIAALSPNKRRPSGLSRLAPCNPELLVAAAILAAVEPWHPARREWRESSRDLGISSTGPGGRMPALYGSQDGRRYNATDNSGMHEAGLADKCCLYNRISVGRFEKELQRCVSNSGQVRWPTPGKLRMAEAAKLIEEPHPWMPG